MAKNDSNDGCASVVGGVLVFIVVVIMAIPKEVWIALGVFAGIAAVVAIIVKSMSAYEKRRIETAERDRVARAAQLAAAKQHQEENARREKQRRITTLGTKNAELVESTMAAVGRIVASEAARAGWLGDVDFTADIQGITDNFRKAHALREVARKLAVLDKPSTDDRRILAEAKTTAANLECTGIERADLIGKCAKEARFIDESLRTERKDARTAEQRAELHSQLSGMLYGIEATPDTRTRDSAADAVMARVLAYREIKNQIQNVRDGGSR